MNQLQTRPCFPNHGRAHWWLLVSLAILAVVGAAYWLGSRPGPADYFQRGKTAFRENRLEELQSCADALTVFPGWEPHSCLLRGMARMRRDQLRDALDQFGRARQHPDTRQLAFSLSGELLYAMGNHRDAIRVLLVAVQADPDNVDAHRWLAAACYDVGSMPIALHHLEVVSKLDSEDPRPCRLQGLIHKDFERYDLATTAYQEALRRHENPESWHDVHVELAQCLQRAGRFAEALQMLGTCPPTPEVNTAKAECKLAMGEVEEAAELVENALRKAPQSRDALLAQAEISQKTGDVEKSVDVLERAAELHPRDDLVRYKLAQAYRRLGRIEEATQQAEVAKQLRTLVRQFTKLHEEAFNDTTDADLRYQLGLLAEQLGKPLVATDWFEAALALDPTHQEARTAWQEITQPPRESDVERPWDQ